MKNERYLFRKKIEKILKTFCILGCFLFLTGFCDPGSNYINLEDITIELGEKIPQDKLDYINSYLINRDLAIEDDVPKDDGGHTTKAGNYNYHIVYRDDERMYSKLTNNSATISVVDTIKPEIRIKDTSLSFNYGSIINVNDVAICYDLSSCTISFKNNVDSKKEGNQEITIIASDEYNNTTEVNITIHIKNKPSYYSPSYSIMENYNKTLNSNLNDSDKQILRNKIIEYAKLFVGNPYVMGGNSLTNGIDCSGYTKAIYGYFGYSLPRASTGYVHIGKSVKKSELLPGDIVVFHNDGMAYHVAIYLGNNKVIHASNPRDGIKISNLWGAPQLYRRIIY